MGELCSVAFEEVIVGQRVLCGSHGNRQAIGECDAQLQPDNRRGRQIYSLQEPRAERLRRSDPHAWLFKWAIQLGCRIDLPFQLA